MLFTANRFVNSLFLAALGVFTKRMAE